MANERGSPGRKASVRCRHLVQSSEFVSIILLVFLLPPGSGNSDVGSSKSPSTSKCELTDPSANSTNITCTIVPSENRTLSDTVVELLRLKNVCLGESGLSKNVALTVLCVPLGGNYSPDLTINLTRLSQCLPHIHTFSAAECNLTKASLKGWIPPSLKSLNLSYNCLETLPSELFQQDYKLELAQVDLRNNTKLRNFPDAFLNLTSIHRIWLGAHNLTCAWVAQHLFHWYKKNPDIFQDAETYDCKTQKDEQSVKLSVSGALKAKKVQTDHCENVTKSCSCFIYTVHKAINIGKGNFPSSFKSYGEEIFITLKVDCSNRSLTALPTLSPLVRFLNASHNQIKSLEELGSSTYANLGHLDVEFNEIENIDSIVTTQFVKHFDVLGLSHNRISELKPFVMKALLEDVVGHGRISLGENPIKCNCDTYQQVRPLLTKYRWKVDAKDAKLISCLNLRKIKVQELEALQVCDWGDENSQSTHWYWIITIEIILIFMVIVKVWHDSHQYRQEGVLPWCSQKMPRLPCEFMLE